jgi:cancer susceptibility candidate protein 1
MPVDEDAKGSGINLKSRDAEERAILDIATTMRAFAYRSSKWNKDANEENIVVKIRENLEFDREFFEDYEPDWRYLMWYGDKVTFIECNDEADEFNGEIPDKYEVKHLVNFERPMLYCI